MPDLLQPKSAQELIDLVELSAVHFTEVHSTREVTEDVDEGQGVDINMVPGLAEGGTKIGVIVTANVIRKEIKIRMRLEVTYDLKQEIEMPESDVMADFLGATTLITVAPYIREAVGTLAARVGVEAPIFPLVRATKLVPDYDPNDEESESEG